MRRTYADLKTEIARLQTEAERVRQLELPTVIAELNMLIEQYQLTEPMLFGVSSNGSPGRPKIVMVPKYVDQITGNSWTGHGPKPRWVVEALRDGHLAENLLVG